METKKPNGRKAKHTMSTDYQKERRIYLDDTAHAILKAYGNGNFSAGVRRAANLILLMPKA